MIRAEAAALPATHAICCYVRGYAESSEESTCNVPEQIRCEECQDRSWSYSIALAPSPSHVAGDIRRTGDHIIRCFASDTQRTNGVNASRLSLRSLPRHPSISETTLASGSATTALTSPVSLAMQATLTLTEIPRHRSWSRPGATPRVRIAHTLTSRSLPTARGNAWTRTLDQKRWQPHDAPSCRR